MIIPNFHWNTEGDATFEFTHSSEQKKELKKQILDRKTYKCWITIDPISYRIIKRECECPDYNINRKKESNCKHLNKSEDQLEECQILE